MLRCAASFVVATYAKVRLTPHDLRALPLNVFEQPLNIVIDEAYVICLCKNRDR